MPLNMMMMMRRQSLTEEGRHVLSDESKEHSIQSCAGKEGCEPSVLRQRVDDWLTG